MLCLRDSELHLEQGSDITQFQEQELHSLFTTECLYREALVLQQTMTQIFALEKNSLYLDHYS